MAKNAEKETALYEAVFRLLARGEKMYSVTVQQIAEEAGIGKGTVYEYFTSREEIISKAMAYRLRGEADALSERVDKAEGFEQKLDTLLCAGFRTGAGLRHEGAVRQCAHAGISRGRVPPHWRCTGGGAASRNDRAHCGERCAGRAAAPTAQ